ncbi:MAG: prepilin peptidase [Clostridia bacterium]|nr:prepilin peptidase [Clostridia bacterium]
MSIFEDTALLVYSCVLAFILGASTGSFLNCAAWRIAHGESFIKGRSRCPACGRELSLPDLVPIFSWIFLRGKCRRCKARISVRYLITELLFALITVACLLRFGLTVFALRNWIFICCLFCLSLVDLDSYIIPNGCLIIAALAWAAALPFDVDPLTALWKGLLAGFVYGGGLLLISLLLDKILKKDSLGGGDIKLFAVIGLYLGFIGTLFSVIIACVLGLLFAVLRRAMKKEGEQIPFGPAIAASAALMLLFGSSLINWYNNLLGI